jgi:HAE1 family hydrophobic/amphiphilic exporter-1
LSSESNDATGLFGFVVTHPVAVTMVFVATLVFGSVSYLRLPIELMPDISYPTITVRTQWDGAAPQELEARVSQPIEEALATLDGLVDIQSRSRAGSSDVVLGFDWGTDMPGASQAIRENLQTTFLPEGAERPLILRYDPSLEPFLRLALSAEGGRDADPQLLARLRSVADLELKRELEGMKGVAAVRVRGGYEREVRVAVREDWLVARGLTQTQVRSALQSENVNIAGGSVLEGDTEYLVRTLNEYTTVDELTHLKIRRADGVVVPLTDVAQITDGHKEREVLSRLDGFEAVELEVFKEADANIVELADTVHLALFGNGAPPEMGGTKGLVAGLPEGVKLAVLDDQAAFIGAAVSNLRSTALVGGFFSVCVLFLFLRDWRATAIIGLSIPISVAIGFAPLYLSGITLNLMSLGGLALGVGMLVDNAVVVLESIQVYREQGHSRLVAAARGTAEVAAAVTASTLTTVAVFAPIAFVDGVAGELFGDLSLAVVASLMASLAVALLLVPTLAALEVEIHPVEGALALVSDGGGLRGLGRSVVGGPIAEARASLEWMRGRAIRWTAAPYVLLRLVLSLMLRAFVVPCVVVMALSARLGVWGLGVVLWVPRRLSEGAATVFLALFARVVRLYDAFLATALRHGVVLVFGAFLAFVGSSAAGAVPGRGAGARGAPGSVHDRSRPAGRDPARHHGAGRTGRRSAHPRAPGGPHGLQHDRLGSTCGRGRRRG